MPVVYTLTAQGSCWEYILCVKSLTSSNIRRPFFVCVQNMGLFLLVIFKEKLEEE